MKYAVIAWCLAILAAAGVSIGLLWTNHEPYEQQMEFGHDFKNRMKEEFFGTNRHAYFIPVEVDKELSENSEGLIAMANTLDIGRGEPAQKVTLYPTPSKELFLSGIRTIDRVGILVFMQESVNRYGDTTGIERIYVAPMKQPHAFVAYKEEYLLPGNASSWSVNALGHENVIFKYDNKETVRTLTVAAAFWGIALLSVGTLMIAFISSNKRRATQ